MGDRTGIEWTNSTWNPWRGCTKVSPGCASCYMFREQRRYGRDPEIVVRASPGTFEAPLAWQKTAQEKGVKPLVFTCSWSDWFHPDADSWREDAWEVIRACPDLTFQILTKRAERIGSGLPADWGEGFKNVWLGVSIENQRFAWRLDELGRYPASVRFVSAEPLLQPLDLSPWLGRARGGVDWVIAGGESGGRPGHPPRLPNPDWIRSLRDQCVAAGVAFFFKQWGGHLPGGEATLDGRQWHELPAAV